MPDEMVADLILQDMQQLTEPSASEKDLETMTVVQLITLGEHLVDTGRWPGSEVRRRFSLKQWKRRK